MFGIRSIPLSSTAALMFAVLLLAIAYRVAQKDEVSYIAQHESSPPLASSTADVFDEREPGDWREELISLGVISSSTPETATSSDPVAYIGDILAEEMLRGYGALKAGDAYSADAARSLGQSLGANVLPIPTIEPVTRAALAVDNDTSPERTLRYRADMRDATSPLISEDPPEIVFFAEFLETGSREKLIAITSAAARYRIASQNLQRVSVPEDAVEYHLRAVNALEAYANALDRLVLFSTQPLASLALMRTYNEAERELLFAFDVLAQYYVRKSAE